MNKLAEERFWNIPNFFSTLRILLIPFFIYMMLQNKLLEALVVFCVASTTDILDGLTARIWHQRTKIGGLLDPAADKLLMTTAIIVLSLPTLSRPNTIPLWLTVAIIGRDIVIVSAAVVIYKLKGQKKFPPSLSGKASTVCQMGVILCVLLFNIRNTSPGFLPGLYILTFVLTLISGFGYGFRGFRSSSRSKQ